MDFMALHPNLRVRIGVAFIQRLVASMVMTFMAIYLAASYGVAAAGALMLVVVVAGVAGAFTGGHMSDVHGRRSTLLIGELGVFATFAVMALADSSWWHSALVVYLCYIVNNFATGYAMPANDAMIVDITTPETRKLAYTVNYWSINLALALGALLGGFLYNGHFTLLLTIAASGMAAALASTYFLITETRPAAAPAAASPLRAFVTGYRTVLRDRLFGRLLVAATLGMAIEMQLIYYVAVRLAGEFPPQRLLAAGPWELHVDGVEMLGILRAENTALVVVLALFSHVMLRGMADGHRLYAGIGMFTAGYMVLAASNTGWVLMVAAAVFTVGELMNVPVKQALLADMVPADARPRYMAVYSLNIRAALVIASLCITLGSVVPPWGMAALYGAFGAVILLQYRAILARTPTTDRAAACPVR